MWRDKLSKKNVLAQITYFHDIDKNGDFKMCFKTIKLLNDIVLSKIYRLGYLRYWNYRTSGGNQ